MAGAIVVGASSGIGRAVAVELARRGERVGVAARRTDLLDELARDEANVVARAAIDVTVVRAAVPALERLIDETGDVRLIVLSSGIGEANRALALDEELRTLDVNARGFTAMANVAFHAMRAGGTLVGLSSVAGVRPSGGVPIYAASKAFVSSYMAGLALKAARDGSRLKVLDVRPGFVRTAMMKAPNAFWVASPETAARQIVDAALAGRSGTLYVTRRWRLVAWLLKVLPNRWVAF